jgi:hypothetical protein
MKSGNLNLLDPSEPVIDPDRDCFTFPATFTGTDCAGNPAWGVPDILICL